jgi:hypothetical protein
MTYLVELIKEKQPEIDKNTVEYVLTYLIKEGHLSYTIQYHYDIYSFYKKCLEHYESLGLQRKRVVADTCEHFKIKKTHLYNIINNFSTK